MARGRGRPPKGFTPPETDLPDLLALWNMAAAAPTGIAIQSFRPHTLANKLYVARRLAGHNEYDNLRVVALVDRDEVRIIRR